MKFFARASALTLGLIFCLFVLEATLRLIGYLETRTAQVAPPASAETFRITCLGNSFTYGAGAKKGMSYPQQLEKLLNGPGPQGFQVFNRGLVNANSSFVADNAATWFQRDRPQVIFAMVGEPNKWNHYGLTEFLRRQKHQTPTPSAVWADHFRSLRIYRLLELFLGRSESWGQTDSELYSNTFTSLKKVTAEDKILLGYLWIGALEGGYFRMSEISEEALTEARQMLSFMVVHGPRNPIATRMVADSLWVKAKKVEDFFPALEAAVKFDQSAFSYPVWRIFRDLENLRPDLVTADVKALRRSLESRVTPAKLMAIAQFFQNPGGDSLKHSHRPDTVLEMLEYYPTHTMSLMHLSTSPLKSKLPKYVAALTRALELNPLSPGLHYINMLLKRLAHRPELVDSLRSQLRRNEERFGLVKFSDIVSKDQLEEDWLIFDLERIVSAARGVGARVVFQTYPPTRNGKGRPVDHIVRKWWRSRNDKQGIELLDVTAELLELSGKGPQADRYFSTHAGPTDQHLNEAGYGEIAKLMLPFVKPAK